MHRVTGGGPLLLQRRAEVMDAYSLLQHSHPALPPDLHDFQVCCLKTCLPSEWHWKYDNCRPTSSPPLLTRRIGTTSSPVCLLAWAKLCPCCSQASSFHRVIFFSHVPITTCSFKVRRLWLLRHSPQSSFSWRPTVRSLDFQLLSETRYCEMDLVITFVALPPHCEPFDSQHQPADLERQLLKRPSVLIVSAEFLASTEVLSKRLPWVPKTNIKGARCSHERWSRRRWKATSCCHWRVPGALEF